jgi:hypothetical protein
MTSLTCAFTWLGVKARESFAPTCTLWTRRDKIEELLVPELPVIMSVVSGELVVEMPAGVVLVTELVGNVLVVEVPESDGDVSVTKASEVPEVTLSELPGGDALVNEVSVVETTEAFVRELVRGTAVMTLGSTKLDAVLEKSVANPGAVVSAEGEVGLVSISNPIDIPL